MISQPEDVMSSAEYRRITGKEEKLEDYPLIGRSKRFATLDKKEKAFLFIAGISILVTAGVAIYRLATISCDGDCTERDEDRTFAILLLMSCVFLLYFSFHGVLREREFELWAFIAALAIVGMYLVWNYISTYQSHRYPKLARLIVFLVAALPNAVLALLVSREFQWLEFRIVGADPHLQNMFRAYSRSSTLLAFDLLMAIYVLILVYNPGAKSKLPEKIIIPFLVALTVILFIVVVKGITRETKSLIILWGLFAFLEPAYFIVKCIYIAVNWTCSEKPCTTSVDWMISAVFYVAAAIAIIVRGITAHYVFICYDNFGQGLKQRAFTSN